MANPKGLSTKEKKKLEKLVVDGLKECGIKAKVEIEASGFAGHYRLFAVSPDFETLSEAERQDILWRVLKDKWKRKDQLRITLSLALSDKEAQGTWS